MKNIIKDIAATSAVSWGTIAEKIDENFKELEDSIPEAGGDENSGIDESQLEEYLRHNKYAKMDDIPSLDGYAKEEALNGKQDALVDGKNIKTINGQSILGEGDIKIEAGGSTSKKQIAILFVGNSLTQDGIAYLPYMLKTYYPEIDFRIYMWYIGGSTLGGHYTNFTSAGKAEIFSVAENSASWTNYNKNVAMATVLQTYKFDIVCMQEYFNYKTEYSDVVDWNNCRDYIRTNYKGGNALEFISLFHAPLRKDGYDVNEVFQRTQAGNALILQETISQDIIPNGIAVYRALDTDLNNLGDLGQLSPDGTHTQEGLPCLLQTYVTLCWLFERLGINKSVYGHPMRMTSTIYNSIDVPGANLGKGVVQGTDAQNILAQEVAIKAYKEGKQFTMRNLYPYAWGGGTVVTQCTFSITTNVGNAVIKINGVEQSSVTVPIGTTVNWEVSKDKYLTQSGSEIVTQDTVKNVVLELVNKVTVLTTEFTQGSRTIFDNEDIESLKNYLIVNATYEDGTNENTQDYELSGILSSGVSTITVSYGGKTSSFDVNVTAFVIPEGYTRYDYIQKKSDSTSRVAVANFMYLKPYEDYNTLSMEVILGKKENIGLDDGGVMGARLASGDTPYYAIYWQEENTSNARINVGLRSVINTTIIPKATSRVKVIIDNPEESPYTVNVNGVVSHTEWTSSPVIPYGMCLFNNIPNGSTSTFYINRHARIGDIILRDADGECVGYYTPVVYDGIIGMYDQISKSMYTASNTNAVNISNGYYSVGNWE